MEWARRHLDGDDLSGMLASTSISFDLSIFELFVPLALGGRVVLVENALALLEEGAGEGVRVLNTVPSVLSELLSSGALPASVRTVLLAGEALPRSLAAALYATGTVHRVFNLYGPSEDTTYSTGAEVAADSAAAPSIGRPLGGAQAYVVDHRLRPVGPGVHGELLLGGSGLARGYLGRPGVSASVFVPDAFGESFGGRLYRTGDRVRWLEDGVLEFLGRLDHQVKLRGFRIELGEIESRLGFHEGVRQAVVVMRGEGSGARLVGYVAAESAIPTVDSLRSWLGAGLPEYMVPGAFVFLEEFPRTGSGKVDRRALPAPDLGEVPEGRAPSTPTEEIVATLFGEVLGLESVSAEDSFFELGGHSLLATQVISRIHKAFGVELPLRRLFESPTVAALARVVSSARQGEGRSLPPLVRRPEDMGPPPLSYAQERLWFLDRLEPGSSAYNMPMPLRLKGPLHREWLSATLAEVVRRHESLRTRFVELEGTPAQWIDPPPSNFPLPLADLTALPEEVRRRELTRCLSEDAVRPFDLARGPLLRCTLLRLDEEEHVAAVNQHHIVSDGWSLGILVREVSELYGAASARDSVLDPLPVHYADYAVWQRSWLQGEELERQLEYWRERFAGVPGLLELPLDRPRPAVQRLEGARRSVTLSASLSARLISWSRSRGATPFMTLLSAFQVLLARWSGQLRVAVGTPIAGRAYGETESLIGFFVNTLALVGDCSGEPSFEEMVDRVRESALSAHEHQDLPFEKLVEELSPERSLSHSPLFQVMFSLQNLPSQELELEDLRLESVSSGVDSSEKFDLSLILAEEGDLIGGTLSWSRALFESTTMARFSDRLIRLLEEGLNDPTRMIHELPLLSPAEWAQVTWEWNDRTVSLPEEASLTAALESVVTSFPEAVAVAYGNHLLTYEEFDRRSDRLARRLVEAGVGEESPVGVFLERSPEMLLAFVAILKAGGLYLPLDLEYPAHRLSFMLEDSGAAWVLTDPALSEDLPPSAAELLFLDSLAMDSGERWETPLPHAGGDQLAYVIYTSGSTGRPKGVAVSHRNVLRLVTHARYVDLSAGLRLGQASNASFDAATFEIWGALLHGGCVVGMDRESLLSSSSFQREIQSLRVGLLFVTTAVFHQLALAGPGVFRGLEHIIFGGEAGDSGTVVQALAEGGAKRWTNAYGPTECTTFASMYDLSPGPSRTAVLPIGRPLSTRRSMCWTADSDLWPRALPESFSSAGRGWPEGICADPL